MGFRIKKQSLLLLWSAIFDVIHGKRLGRASTADLIHRFFGAQELAVVGAVAGFFGPNALADRVFNFSV